MSISTSDLHKIHEALDREPGWKLVLLETSGEAFREWLRRVLPSVFTRICESSEEMLLRVLG